jgi:glycosyltransferase involved in cell wall biosynthesis
MKVLLICGAGIVSGKEIMSLHLLKELKARGYTCSCIVASWGSEDFRDRLRVLGISFYNLRIGFISKTLSWPAVRMTFIQCVYLPVLYVKYYRLVNRLKPNVVIHTNFHHAFILYPLLARHGNIYWSHEVLGYTRFYRSLFRLFEKKIALFVAVSQAAGKPLCTFVDKSKVRVITNGISVSEPVVSKRELGQKLQFAIVGQVSEPKGHELLLRALVEVPKDKYILKIIGTGANAYIDHLRLLALELGLIKNCLWMGFVKGTDNIYEGIDVVIVPSKFSDPFPTTVMEAGMRAIPVIGSDSGGIPEMVKDGVNGFLFKSGNQEDLHNTILKLINWSDFDLLRQTSRSFAITNFNLSLFATRFDESVRSISKDD